MKRLALLALILFPFCAAPVRIRFGPPHARAPIVASPTPDFADGDPVAGRRAFIDMRCIDCHRVAEDPELPRGARAAAGPIIGGMNRHSSQEVARRITSRTTGASEELWDRTMKDYTQPLTARQLVDLVAYLRNPKMPPG